jgi:hypothetical protein
MARVFVHLPLNISRALEQFILEFSREMEKKYGLQVDIESQIQCRPDNVPENDIDESSVPDLVVGSVDYLANFPEPEDYLEHYYCSLPGRFPIRPELTENGFADPKGYFHPFVIMPFAIFYNAELLEQEELPHTWEDLFDSRWQDKICLPDRHHMAPKMIRAYIRAYYSEKYDVFQKNLVYQGAPINVINALTEGWYPLGMTNISFARIAARNQKIRLLWPQDGLFCLPQVMMWSKKADERLLEIGDFLLSRQVQEYLALQTFVPVSAEVVMPYLLTENNCGLRWKDWDDFLSVIKGRYNE